MELDKNKISLPLVVTRGFIMFPHNSASLDIIKEESEKAIAKAQNNYDGYLILSSQINTKVNTVDVENIYKVGCLCQITNSKSNPDGSLKVGLRAISRVKMETISIDEGLMAEGVIVDEISGDYETEAALVRVIAKTLNTNNLSFGSMPAPVASNLARGVSASVLANTLAFYLDVDRTKKQAILEADNINDKLNMIIERLNQEKLINDIEQEINNRVKEKLEENQRDYILREKLRVIKEELGDIANKDKDIDELRSKVENNPYPENVKAKILEELKKYEMTPSSSPEASIIRTYIDILIELPWYQMSEEVIDISVVEKILNEDHYGLKKPKERILEYLAVRKYTKSVKSPILCFIGPPGVGKTSLALSIARAINRKFVKISLGGVHDESEIRGHRRTYIGAMPGKIIQGMRKVGVANPVFVLDEIDKLGNDQRGDPSSALLEVLDPEQNHLFNDHYLEETFDLSKVLFIATANYIGNIPHALRDRLEIINLSSYTEIEKLHIVKNHLIPKQIKAHELEKEHIAFSDDAILHVIRYYTKESGVRQLERYIATICRKIITNFVKSNEERIEVLVDINKVKEYLGKELFDYTKKEKTNQIGLVNGLAYTDFGGDLIPVEVNYFSGKGRLVVTGNLGDVMKESANIGLDYIKANSKKLGIDETIFDKIDIHIHVPEGAVPKDGPSAGVTMATAIVSALTNEPVRNDVAMTGEITLRGNVLPIGGLKEKSISAHRAGIKTIVIPHDNEKDLDEIPDVVKENVEIIFADRIEEVLQVALVNDGANHVSVQN